MSRVLVVEDNQANLKLVRDLLKREGLDVLTAGDAHTGIAIAKEQRPALIIMDVQLPGTDGLVATRVLKADPSTARIPVIILTAHAMRGDETRIPECGCDHYVSKPIRYKEFLAIVRQALGDGASAQEDA